MYTVVSLSDVKTAGVLLREEGRWVFCYGPHVSGGVYVFRIGGHREPEESPWECAAREAGEEAATIVHQVPSEVSVQTDGAHGTISTLPWPAVVEGHPEERPLVLGGSLEPATVSSTLFLAETTVECDPRDQIFGLVKLTPDQVVETVRVPGTFGKIEGTAESQEPQSRIPSDTPIVLSSHLRALAFCLERGYI